MSAQHCSVKNGKKGKGASHSMYVSGTGKYSEREDLLGVISGNLPGWAKTGTDFFAAADSHERENGRSYREVEFAIPREVAEPVLYASQFAEKLLGKDFVFVLGVHSKIAADGKPNTHGHLMFSERKLDGIERTEEKFFSRANKKNPEKGGTAKDRDMNSKEFVKKVRALHKAHAAENGVELDMRNWKERGADRPEPKLGPVHPRANLNPVRELKQETVTQLRYERVEDERYRKAAFGRIGKNFSRAGRASNFTKSDLGSIGEKHRAIEIANGSVEQAIAAKRHHEAATAIVESVSSAVGRAVPQIARAVIKIKEIDMATQAQRELAAAATAHKKENPAYKPSLEVLKAVDAVLVEKEQEKPSKSTLEAFLKGDRYIAGDGKESALRGCIEPGAKIDGKVVGHIDLQEGKFSLVHMGRGVVQIAAGILAAIGEMIDEIAQGRGKGGKGGHGD